MSRVSNPTFEISKFSMATNRKLPSKVEVIDSDIDIMWVAGLEHFIKEKDPIAALIKRTAELYQHGPGPNIIQLRLPDLSNHQISMIIDEIQKIVEGSDIKIIVTDNVKMALKVHGLWLDRKDYTYEEAREQLGPDAYIGYTVDSVGEISYARGIFERGEKLFVVGMQVDESDHTKADKHRLWRHEGVQEFLIQEEMPVVPIGGLYPDRPVTKKTMESLFKYRVKSGKGNKIMRCGICAAGAFSGPRYKENLVSYRIMLHHIGKGGYSETRS